MPSLNATIAKNDLLVRLGAARREVSRAQMACSHWDMEDDGDARSDCCYDLAEAYARLRDVKEDMQDMQEDG